MANTIDINDSPIFDIKANNQRKITALFNEHKAPFINYSIKNFKLKKGDAENIYQEAFLALHQNVQNGKLTNLTVPLRTYLFQIGKNKIYDFFKRAGKEVDIVCLLHLITSENELGDFDLIYEDEDSDSERKKLIVYNTVSEMGSPCKEVLFYYFWDDKSMKEIAELMNYSSSDVAKTQKSKCMKKIAVYITERLRNEY